MRWIRDPRSSPMVWRKRFGECFHQFFYILVVDEEYRYLDYQATIPKLVAMRGMTCSMSKFHVRKFASLAGISGGCLHWVYCTASKKLKLVLGKKGPCHVLSTLLENRLYYFALLLSEIFFEYRFNQAGTNLFKLTNWPRQIQCPNACVTFNTS